MAGYRALRARSLDISARQLACCALDRFLGRGSPSGATRQWRSAWTIRGLFPDAPLCYSPNRLSLVNISNYACRWLELVDVRLDRNGKRAPYRRRLESRMNQGPRGSVKSV